MTEAEGVQWQLRQQLAVQTQPVGSADSLARTMAFRSWKSYPVPLAPLHESYLGWGAFEMIALV